MVEHTEPGARGAEVGWQAAQQHWAATARGLTWQRPYDVLWQPGPRMGSWFCGGRLNASVNCVDRHLEDRGDQVAVYWEGEPGDRRSLTFAELHEQVLALTRGLRGMGVGAGDRVGLHLGWLPETVVAMLACARIGAVHTVLPTPLPAEALADRLSALEPKLLFTQDGAWRHGTVLPLKSRADEALSAAEGVEQTIVVRRTGMDVAWYEGDRWYHDVVAATRPGQAPAGDDPAALDAEHPLLSNSLANKGGQPVSVLHGTAHTVVSASAVHRGLSSGEIFWCAGDIAWAVTQLHGIYGPLAHGQTTVMYEGTLDIPTHTRAWEIIARYDVTTLLTSPSVVRTVRGWSRELPGVGATTTLQRVVTAGEPVEPELRQWLIEALGGGELDVADGWGQLELGGIVRVDRPADPVGLPDCGLQIVDDDGHPVPEETPGEVVLTLPWAGTMCGVEGAQAAVTDSHWTRRKGVYSTGDLARRRSDGSITFLGRFDNLVSVSGQLVSLREVEEVLGEHPFVEAVTVAVRKDAEMGRSLFAAVVLTPEATGAPGSPDRVAVDLMDTVREVMGGLARPRALLFVDRFGDELTDLERAEVFATLATPDRRKPRQVTWRQVLAAAGHP